MAASLGFNCVRLEMCEPKNAELHVFDYFFFVQLNNGDEFQDMFIVDAEASTMPSVILMLEYYFEDSTIVFVDTSEESADVLPTEATLCCNVVAYFNMALAFHSLALAFHTRCLSDGHWNAAQMNKAHRLYQKCLAAISCSTFAETNSIFVLIQLAANNNIAHIGNLMRDYEVVETRLAHVSETVAQVFANRVYSTNRDSLLPEEVFNRIAANIALPAWSVGASAA